MDSNKGQDVPCQNALLPLKTTRCTVIKREMYCQIWKKKSWCTLTKGTDIPWQGLNVR